MSQRTHRTVGWVLALSVLMNWGLLGRIAAAQEVAASIIDEAVVGLPIPLSLAYHGPMSTVVSSAFNQYNGHELRLEAGAIGYRIARRWDGYQWRDISYVERYEDGVPAGERRRKLVLVEADPVEVDAGGVLHDWTDLSKFAANRWVDNTMEVEGVPSEEWQPSLYTMTLIPNAQEQVTYGNRSLQLVSPNSTELALVNEVAAQEDVRSSPEGRWITFVMYYDDIAPAVDLSGLSVIGQRQMQYFVILGRLVHAGVPVADLEITAEDKAGLWPGYSLPLMLLEYEIAAAKNNEALKATLRQQILAEQPDRVAFLNFMDVNCGAIEHMRQQLSP